MAKKEPLNMNLLKEPPEAGEVHVHVIPLGKARPEYEHLLSDAELERARRLHREIDSIRFIVAHGSLRCILATYLGTDPQRIQYKRGTHGKPMLDSGIFNSSLMFNISHSGNLGVIAVANGVEVGVDIEQIRDDFPICEISRSVFSPAERQYLHDSLDPVKSFFMIWARKEAYVKGIGEGLNIQLDDIDVLMNDRSHRFVSDDSEWSIADMAISDGYASAIAIHGNLCDLTVYK